MCSDGYLNESNNGKLTDLTLITSYPMKKICNIFNLINDYKTD